MQSSNVVLLLFGFGAILLSVLSGRLAPVIAGFFARLDRAHRSRAPRLSRPSYASTS